MKTKLILACIAVVSLAGCQSTPTPHLDDHFGEAVNQAKALQTINPDASRNTDPVAGIDGNAAKAIVDRYHEGMKKEPAPATIINIGGSLTGENQ